MIEQLTELKASFRVILRELQDNFFTIDILLITLMASEIAIAREEGIQYRRISNAQVKRFASSLKQLMEIPWDSKLSKQFEDLQSLVEAYNIVKEEYQYQTMAYRSLLPAL